MFYNFIIGRWEVILKCIFRLKPLFIRSKTLFLILVFLLVWLKVDNGPKAYKSLAWLQVYLGGPIHGFLSKGLIKEKTEGRIKGRIRNKTKRRY